MTNKIRVNVVEDCLTAFEHDVYETKEAIQRNEEPIQRNWGYIVNQHSTLLKLMKDKEIDEEKMSIYDKDREGLGRIYHCNHVK